MQLTNYTVTLKSLFTFPACHADSDELSSARLLASQQENQLITNLVQRFLQQHSLRLFDARLKSCNIDYNKNQLDIYMKLESISYCVEGYKNLLKDYLSQYNYTFKRIIIL
jgi:hypothetical protein